MNHVGMDRSQTTIQGGQAPAVSPRQGREIGIADLAVTDGSTEINSVITEIVGPEAMSFVDDHVAEERGASSPDAPSRTRNRTSVPWVMGHVANGLAVSIDHRSASS